MVYVNGLISSFHLLHSSQRNIEGCLFLSVQAKDAYDKFVQSFKEAVPAGMPSPSALQFDAIVYEHKQRARAILQLLRQEFGNDVSKRLDFDELYEHRMVAGLGIVCQGLALKLSASEELRVLCFRLPDELLRLLSNMIMFLISSMLLYLVFFFFFKIFFFFFFFLKFFFFFFFFS